MLYSGACEQPVNTSIAARVKPASGRSGVIRRRRSCSVDSAFIGQTSYVSKFVLIVLAHPGHRRSLDNLDITVGLGHTAEDGSIGPKYRSILSYRIVPGAYTDNLGSINTFV
jgi:hypothetical protein